jgi:hypothetical protein
LPLLAVLGIVIHLVTDTGAVKITGKDPDLIVRIDGGRAIQIENVGEPITLRTGAHDLEVLRGDLWVKTRTFQIRRGQETLVEVTYTPKPRPAPPTPEETVKKEAESKKEAAPPVVKKEAEPKNEALPPVAKKAAEPKPAPPPPAVVKNEPEPEKAPPAPRAEPEIITTQVGQIKLKRVPAGTFLMGSPAGEGSNDEHPQHEVRISRPFYLGVYEVTQDQYQVVMGRNPSEHKGSGDLPVEQVSWLDAVKFCNTLSQREDLNPFYEIDDDNVRVPDWSGTGYRLPTEAEWEYACRAGSTTKYGFGDNEKALSEYAWFYGNSQTKTHPVG